MNRKFVLILGLVGILLMGIPCVVRGQPAREPFYSFGISNNYLALDMYSYRYYEYYYVNMSSPVPNPIHISEEFLVIDVAFTESLKTFGVMIANDTINVGVLGTSADVYLDGVVTAFEDVDIVNNFTIGWHNITVVGNGIQCQMLFYQEVNHMIPKPPPPPVWVSFRLDFYSSIDGFGLDPSAFLFYLNSTRLTDLTNITVMVGATYNLTVTDYFGNKLKQYLYTVPPDQGDMLVGVNVSSPMGLAMIYGGLGGAGAIGTAIAVVSVRKYQDRKGG